jgi:hypothetical protein
MADNYNDRSKNIQENFEKILPQLWEKARANEEKLKSEYMKTLLSKLLDDVRSHISKPAFDTWFSGFSIEGLNIDESIVFGTNSKMKMEWIEQRYSKMLKATIKSITNADFKVSFIVSEYNAKNIDNASEQKDKKY